MSASSAANTSASAASDEPGTPDPASRRSVGTARLASRLAREFLSPYLGQLVLAVGCMIAMALATAATAWLMEPAINKVFLARQSDALWWVAGGIFLAFVVRALGNYGQAMIVTTVGLRLLADARDRLHDKIWCMELRFFQARTTGNLVTRFTADVQRMRFSTANTLKALGSDLVSLVALMALVFWQDWVLAIIALVIAPLTVLPVRWLGRKVRRRTRDIQEETGRLHALMTQCLRGIRVVWIDDRRELMSDRVSTLINRIFRRQTSGERARALITPIMELASGVALGLALYVGATRVLDGATDPGRLTSMLAALLMAYQPAKRLANLYSIAQEGLAAAERLFDVLDTPADLRQSPDAVPLPPGPGRIRFQDVSFAYLPDKPVLEGITLDIAPGEVVALVGASGAGKSTLLNLVPRFLDVTGGSVSVDGLDVRSLTLASLRARIALVTQETFLFDDTIRANLLYARPDASADDIESAARAADAWSFISALPEGLDTQIGAMGGRLSGGERQRLAIARAILKDVPILLLDEPTSALDTAAETRVQAALDRLAQGRTTLIVAHRLSTIVRADRICVLDGGRLVEQGRHEDLLANGNVYANLYHDAIVEQDARTRQ